MEGDEAIRCRRRHAGLLAPVSALRHARDSGVGDTRAVRDALPFCAEHGFGVLPILPIHATLATLEELPHVALAKIVSPSPRNVSPAAMDPPASHTDGFTAEDGRAATSLLPRRA